MIGFIDRHFPEWNEWGSARAKWIVSWKIWAFWLPGVWLGTVAIESASHEEPIPLVSGLTASLVGQLAGGALLWLASVTWLRGRFVRPVSLTIVLATWFASGVATYVTTDLLLRVMNSSPEIDAPTILLAYGASVMLRWFTSVAVLAGFEVLRSKRLEERQSLETERDLLAGLHSYAEAIDVELRSFITTILQPRINTLRTEIDSLLGAGFSQPESFDHVREIATDASNKARSLSHAIASMDWAPIKPNTPEVTPRSATEWAAEFFGYLPRVLPVTLWLVLVQLTWAWTSTDLPSTIVLIFIQTVVIVGFLAFGHVVKRLMTSAPGPYIKPLRTLFSPSL